jgi:hypothetical protein
MSKAILVAMLPGPDRKRAESLYQYRLLFRDVDPLTEGCVALWQVSGGRMAYQVALQRDERGEIHWHCTCADHAYRHELSATHCCKHVRGLREFIPPLPPSPSTPPRLAWVA